MNSQSWLMSLQGLEQATCDENGDEVVSELLRRRVVSANVDQEPVPTPHCLFSVLTGRGQHLMTGVQHRGNIGGPISVCAEC